MLGKIALREILMGKTGLSERGRLWSFVPLPLPRGVFRPRQTRQLPRAVDLKGRLLSCKSY